MKWKATPEVGGYADNFLHRWVVTDGERRFRVESSEDANWLMFTLNNYEHGRGGCQQDAGSPLESDSSPPDAELKMWYYHCPGQPWTHPELRGYHVPVDVARKLQRERNEARQYAKKLERALREVIAHDGPGFSHGMCAKIAEDGLSIKPSATGHVAAQSNTERQ